MPAHPVTQVITYPRPGYSALVPVQRQFQALIQEALNTPHHSHARTRTAHINVRIVGITYKAMTPSLTQLTVEFVEDVTGRVGSGAVACAPFPHPARQTGRALLTHPAFVRDRYAFALDTSAIRTDH